MLYNHFRIAFRNMSRNMRFTLVHVTGLSIALASVILITWYVLDELNFDDLPHADQVFRINTYWGEDPGSEIFATTPPPLAAAIKGGIPQVSKVARAFNWNHSTMRLPAEETSSKGEVVFRETRIFIVDPEFLEVLEYPIIDGDRAKAFERPESIVLTRETATRYFGEAAVRDNKVLGKHILFGGDRSARVVTAVVDPPDNTHLHFDMLVNINFGYKELDTLKAWTWNIMHTYVKVSEQVAQQHRDRDDLQAQLKAMAEKQLNPETPEAKASANFKLQPLRDIHLHSHLVKEHEANGDYTTVQLLTTVAILIVLLACANFINLFTAQTAKRSKEVGVRKTLGSSRSTLASQFFIESSLYTIIAVFLALSISELLRQPFNALCGKQMEFSWFAHPGLIAGLIGALILIILISGSYPSLYLSALHPVKALKSSLSSQKNYLRNSLVVFQFAISIGLMICSVFIMQQLNFMTSRAPGYDRDNVIVVKNGEVSDQWRTFRDELEAQTPIAKASFTTGLPTQTMTMMRDFRHAGDPTGVGINVLLVDEHYLETLNINLKSGAQFSDNPAKNEHQVMLNETAAHLLGVKNVGELLVLNYGAPEEERIEVIGIVEDFHMESLHNKVKPLVLYYFIPDLALDYITVKIHGGALNAGIEAITNTWRKFEPENPFEYSFLDKDFERQYLSEQRLTKLFGAFTILTIIIALLGITGLASFMAEQRTKEVGIRKVMGASVSGIMVLFSRDFTRLALIATLIAVPSSYLVISGWLGDFAYRITLQPAVFVACSFFALLLMWATVCLLSLKVARLNPASTLRAE